MSQYSKPKVSVITIVYNSVKTIEDTIQSVVNQTYPNIEYIVVDGGSTDGTLGIIAAYSDKISKFISEKDKGISDGFNKGLSLATGDWICYLNADDWYAADAIELMMNQVKPDDDVICGDVMLIGANGHAAKKKSKVNWLNLGMYIMHPTCFVRSWVYRKVGPYDIDLKVCMDYDVFLRIKRHGFKMRYVDVLVTYQRTGGNSSNVERMHIEELEVMRRNLNDVDYYISLVFNYLNRLRWKFFYKDPFSVNLK